MNPDKVIDLYCQIIRLPLDDIKLIESLLTIYRHKEELKQENYIKEQVKKLTTEALTNDTNSN